MSTEDILNSINYEYSECYKNENDDDDNESENAMLLYKNMKKKARQWQTCAEEIEIQFNLLKKKYKKLKGIFKEKEADYIQIEKQMKDKEEQYQKHQLLMEKTVLLKDTEIEKLNIQCRDLKERLSEIQSEYKEMKKRIYTISTQTKPVKTKKI